MCTFTGVMYEWIRRDISSRDISDYRRSMEIIVIASFILELHINIEQYSVK